MTNVAVNPSWNRLCPPEAKYAGGQAESFAASAPAVAWHAPPRHLALADHEVHIWRAWLDVTEIEIQRFTNVLSEDERHRAGQFRYRRDRSRFIAGRGMLRKILGHYLDAAPGALKFRYSATGKPGLSPEFSQDLRFNMAHSNSLALYAVTREAEVGIDLEQVGPISEAEEIAGCFFTASENAWLRSVPPPQYMEAFYRIWTRKEARLKACGTGVAAGLNQADVSLFADGRAHLEGDTADTLNPFDWPIHDLTPAFRYVGAVARKGRGRSFTISYFS